MGREHYFFNGTSTKADLITNMKSQWGTQPLHLLHFLYKNSLQHANLNIFGNQFDKKMHLNQRHAQNVWNQAFISTHMNLKCLFFLCKLLFKQVTSFRSTIFCIISLVSLTVLDAFSWLCSIAIGTSGEGTALYCGGEQKKVLSIQQTEAKMVTVSFF